MRIDRGDGCDGTDNAEGHPDGTDAPEAHAAERSGLEQSDKSAPGDGANPAERVIAYRDKVDAVRRAYAIDQGCAEIEKIETDTVTPAMLRIEAEDPDRRLVGLENRLKGKDRLAEKVENWMTAQPGIQPDDAFRLAKDAIRYTFVYEEAKYTAGVYADCDRLESQGFQPVDRQNSWTAINIKESTDDGGNQALGICSRYSFTRRTATTRSRLPMPPMSVSVIHRRRQAKSRQLRDYQREVCATLPIPPGATEIPDYNYL